MKVKVIAEIGKAVLVEWYDGCTRRATLPQSVVTDGVVSELELTAGVPYGVPWEDVVSAELAAELRRVGIWTGRDLAEHPQVAAAAIQRVNAVTLAALRRAAAESEGGSR